jgi:hypothetical protein
MKIIFLDIDGVLNSEKSMTESKDEKWSDEPSIENIECLNYIIAKTGAKIVISSTWRHGNHASLFDKYFHALGIIGEVIDVTPWLDSYRGTEIKCWLLEHASKIKKYKNSQWCMYKEPVESFVILDDDSDMEDLYNHLVLIDNKVGLTKKDADIAVRILMENKNGIKI